MMARLAFDGVALVDHDAGTIEGGTERSAVSDTKLIELELDFGKGTVERELHAVGEIEDVFDGEMFLDHRLIAFERGERCGAGVVAYDRRPQPHETAQMGVGHAFGEAPDREIAVGQVGEMRLAEEGLAGREKFRKVHGYDVPDFGARAPWVNGC